MAKRKLEIKCATKQKYNRINTRKPGKMPTQSIGPKKAIVLTIAATSRGDMEPQNKINIPSAPNPNTISKIIVRTI